MDLHEGVTMRLDGHIALLDAIYCAWERAGIAHVYELELLDRSRAYVFRGMEQLGGPQRLEHFRALRGLWAPFFSKETVWLLDAGDAEKSFIEGLLDCEVGDCELDERFRLYEAERVGNDARAKVSGELLCRSSGKIYVRYTIHAVEPFSTLGCAAFANDVAVPAAAYPHSGEEGGCDQQWVVELPILDCSEVKLRLHPDDRVSEWAEVTIGSQKAKWLSRLNYRTRGDECSTVRDVEHQHTFRHYQVEVKQRFEADENISWHTIVRWIGDPGKMPRMRVLGASGMPMNAKSLLFEFQPSSVGRLGENVLYLDILVPREIGRFVLVSSDDSGEIESGFAVVDEGRSAVLAGETYDLMRNAGDDDAAYREWLRWHRVNSNVLAAQRAEVIKDGPSFCIVVTGYRGNDSALLETVESMARQTYGNWTVVVGAESDSEWLDEQGIPCFEWVAESLPGKLSGRGDFLAFVEAGDVLEPDALYEYALAIVEAKNEGDAPDCLYCDEDEIEAPGVFRKPLFKSRLNLDLLYCSNWVGNLFVVRTGAFEGFAPFDGESFGAWMYDCALHAYEAGCSFSYVPKVLYHARKSPYVNGSCDIDAMKHALMSHLERRGIAGEVVDGPLAGSLRIRYEMPDPKPLVSIVIPSKDHIDLLEPCVRSIVERSTYRPIEVIVVENNSEDPETFGFYEKIQEELDCVRVVEWPNEFNYSKIVNFGVDHALGEYVVLLNNDTEVIAENWIEEMLGCLQRPEVGVVGAKLLFRDDLVQHAGCGVGVWNAIVHVNQFFTVDNGGYMGRACLPGNFTAVTGACQMIRKSDYEELGRYNEEFAVGFNDIDFCMRVLESGRFVTYTPYALLHHYEFSSRGREVADKRKLMRWKREQGLFMRLWPEPFIDGDLYTSPNLVRDNTYYRL